jgi:SnoaL-like domain
MSRIADDPVNAQRIKSQRTIAERAGVRWPSMARRTMRWVLRLPPGSRVRRAMLARAARIAFLSWNRGDFALVPNLDDPEVETHLTVEGHVATGFDDVYYGPEGHCRVMAIWNEAWPEWDAEIEEIIEEGRDQVLIVARVYGEGAASGITLGAWSAVRYTFREGLIFRVKGAIDPDRDRALEALAETTGLRE